MRHLRVVVVTFEEEQRQRRAAGQTGTATLLDRLEAQAPHLREYAEWLLAAGGAQERRPDQVALAGELRDAILAVRELNARREISEINAFLTDQPDHPAAARWRQRVAELMAYVLEVERSGKVRPRPWAQILAREATLPPRRPHGPTR